MGRSKSSRTGPDDGDLLAIAVCARCRFRLVSRGLHTIGDKPFQGPDGDRLLASRSAATVALARMRANAGANRGEWVGLPDCLIRLFVSTARYMSNVTPRRSTQRTGSLTGSPDQLFADEGPAPVVPDVLLILITEIVQRTQNRVRRRLPQAAHGCVLHNLGQLLEKVYLFRCCCSLGDVVEDLVHPLCPFAAREALATRLILEKAHEVLGHIDHAGVLVHDDHAARAHDRSRLGQAVVVDGQIKHPGGNTPP